MVKDAQDAKQVTEQSIKGRNGGDHVRKFGLITEYAAKVRVEETDVVLTGRQEWRVYKLQTVDHGKHPIHQTDTTETEVWVPEGTYDNPNQAHAHARQLAGMPY